MEVGDIYKVKNPGYTYSIYHAFAEKYGYPDAILDDQLDFNKQNILKRRKVKILAIGQHEDDDKTLAIVETVTKNKPKYRFIIGIEGLVKG